MEFDLLSCEIVWACQWVSGSPGPDSPTDKPLQKLNEWVKPSSI